MLPALFGQERFLNNIGLLPGRGLGRFVCHCFSNSLAAQEVQRLILGPDILQGFQGR